MAKMLDHVWVSSDPGRYGLRIVGGAVHVGSIALDRIAAEVGTPVYVYDADAMATRYRELAAALQGRPTLICYAVKANSSQAVLRHLGRLGAGADIVSGGELQRALAAEIAPERIVFSGVGKSDDEIDAAIEAGIRSINAESADELDRIGARARRLGKVAKVSLRLNPDVDPDTHPYLATGLREAKFGIPMELGQSVAEHAVALDGVDLVGIGCHIGSQIMEEQPFLDSVDRLRHVVEALRSQGVRLQLLDLGGGMGIPYAPGDPSLDVPSWGAAVVRATQDLDLDLVLEPGRFLVGNAGVLVTRALQRKPGEDKTFVVVDAAMNDLLRPALYQAYHAVMPVKVPAEDAPTESVDLVGPVCECGDFFAQGRTLPKIEPGDLVALLSAGAYGMTMASRYNTRPLPAEVMVSGDRYAVIRPRRTVADMIAEETLPHWLD